MKIIEYAVTKSERTTQIGVEDVLIPVRPRGFGWKLCGITNIWSDTIVFWWWRFNPFQNMRADK